MAREQILIDVRQRGARTVKRDIAQIGVASKASSTAVGFLKRALVGLGAITVLAGVVRTLAKFSQEMSTVKAITNATESEFQKLREEAKRLGATTRFSATQAAEGMTFLARAGFETNEVLTATADVLLLAQAGALDLGRAADIASNVLKGMKLEAADTARVVDVLANTAASANTTVEQLGDAMSFAAPAAAALDVSVESAAAAIGSLSDAGVQATRAGTALRAIFIKLSTGSAEKEIKRLGLTTADLDIKARGLVPVLESLRSKNIGLGEATELVGRRQATNLLIMIDSIGKIQELTEANEKAEGVAKRIADTMDNNLNGALLRVKSAFEALVLAFGDLGAESGLTQFFNALAGAIRSLANNLQVISNAATAAGVAMLAAFSARLISNIFATVKAMVALEIALGATSRTAALASVAMKTLQRAVQALTVTMAKNPILLLAVAAAAAVTALTLLRDEIVILQDESVTLGDFMDATWTVIGNKMEKVNNFIADTLGPTFKAFGIDISGVGDIASLIFSLFIRQIDGMLGVIVGAKRAVEALFDGEDISDAFFEGLNSRPLQSLLDEIKTEARLLAAERQGIFDDFENAAIPDPEPRTPGAEDAEGGTAGGASVPKPKFSVDEMQSLLDTLDPVAAAQRQFAEGQEIIDAASVKMNLTIGETVTLHDELRRQMEDQLDPLAAMSRELDKERALLMLDADARGAASRAMDIENQLREAGVSQIDIQNAAILEQVTALNELQKATAKQDEILRRIKGPQQDYEENLKAINALLDKGKINANEYSEALRENRKAFLESQTDAASGFELGGIQILEEFTNQADLARDAVVSAFKGMEDALVEFVKTGKLDFSSLIDSILADLTRIAVRDAITGPLAEMLFGGLGSGFGGTGAGSVVSNGAMLSGGGAGQSGTGGFDIFGLLGGLFGFQHGGSFEANDNNTMKVAGAGTDDRLAMFRVRSGDQMRVNLPGQDAGGGGGNITLSAPITIQGNVTDPKQVQRAFSRELQKFGDEVARQRSRNG